MPNLNALVQHIALFGELIYPLENGQVRIQVWYSVSKIGPVINKFLKCAKFLRSLEQLGLNFDDYLGFPPKITPAQRYATQQILSTPTSSRIAQFLLMQFVAYVLVRGERGGCVI